MEHKLISGGEQWLAFARSRIKALRATGLKYASQQFEIDGCSVKVRITDGHEYITLSGGGAWVAWAPHVPLKLSRVNLRPVVAYSAVPKEPPKAPDRGPRPEPLISGVAFGWPYVDSSFGQLDIYVAGYYYGLAAGNSAFFGTSDITSTDTGDSTQTVVHNVRHFYRVAHSSGGGVPGSRSFSIEFSAVLDSTVTVTRLSTVTGSGTSTDMGISSLGSHEGVVDPELYITANGTAVVTEGSGTNLVWTYTNGKLRSDYQGTGSTDDAAGLAWDAQRAQDISDLEAANLEYSNVYLPQFHAQQAATRGALYLAARRTQRTLQQEALTDELAHGAQTEWLNYGAQPDYTPKRQRATPLFIKWDSTTPEEGTISYKVKDYSDREALGERTLVGTWVVANESPQDDPTYGARGATRVTFANLLPEDIARVEVAGCDPFALQAANYAPGQVISGTLLRFPGEVGELDAYVRDVAYAELPEQAAWQSMKATVPGIDPLAPNALVRTGVSLYTVTLEYEIYDASITNEWRWLTAGLQDIDPILPSPQAASSGGVDIGAAANPRAVRAAKIFRQEFRRINKDDEPVKLGWTAAKEVTLADGKTMFSGNLGHTIEHLVGEGVDAHYTRAPLPTAVFILRGVEPDGLPLSALDRLAVSAKRLAGDPVMIDAQATAWEDMTRLDDFKDRLVAEAIFLVGLAQRPAAH